MNLTYNVIVYIHANSYFIILENRGMQQSIFKSGRKLVGGFTEKLIKL